MRAHEALRRVWAIIIGLAVAWLIVAAMIASAAGNYDKATVDLLLAFLVAWMNDMREVRR